MDFVARNSILLASHLILFLLHLILGGRALRRSGDRAVQNATSAAENGAFARERASFEPIDPRHFQNWHRRTLAPESNDSSFTADYHNNLTRRMTSKTAHPIEAWYSRCFQYRAER